MPQENPGVNRADESKGVDTMSTDSAPHGSQAANLASIFQKAYARAVALQRMDEQIAALLEQRQKFEDDFREAQAEVNEECDRMLRHTSIAPAKFLSHFADSVVTHEEAETAGANGHNGRLKAMAQ
jgi:hypothetical protein